MAEDRTRLIEAVDQLAVQARLVKYDDLMGLGALLEKLEAVEGFTSGPDQTLTRLLCESLETLLKRVILNKSSSPKQEMELFAEGMKWVRQRVMLSDSPSLLPEEVSFLENSKRVMGETGPTSERKKEELPSQESSQTSFDLTQDLGLYRDFISEALEHLETIELNIIELEQSPDDKECISNIFRPFHTIKGVSGFLNLRDINRFSHSMESLLDLARNDEIKIHREIVDFILEAVDFLKKMILDLRTHLEQGQTAFSHFDLTPYLKRIASFQQGEEPTPSSPEPGRPFEAREQSFGPPLGEILRSKGIISPDQVNSALQRQSEMRKDQKIGQILVNEFDVKPVEVISALRDQKRVTSQEVETTVKVTTSKLDNLVDLVGELVITQALVQQNPAFSSLQDQKLAQDFSQLKRITTDLQRNSMSLRMIPIRHTFQKMIRLIRDLAQKSNKLVELCMSGEDTEIDRNMVDSLYDPLVHMIRNSIDHGIESPEVRKEKGKPEAGTILLKAYQKGGNVVIEVEDDGQGLNRTKILQKAKDRGLVSDEVQLTDHQIDNLIFEAGFSTAE
ncbi:MAG TPA: Hpt domain-containing protein, partial [Thermodesulfobacteriota bacterium]|nr:Hpt domain-containing protein [Thermodesulfobacteriota bacterium]